MHYRSLLFVLMFATVFQYSESLFWKKQTLTIYNDIAFDSCILKFDSWELDDCKAISVNGSNTGYSALYDYATDTFKIYNHPSCQLSEIQTYDLSNVNPGKCASVYLTSSTYVYINMFVSEWNYSGFDDILSVIISVCIILGALIVLSIIISCIRMCVKK